MRLHRAVALLVLAAGCPKPASQGGQVGAVVYAPPPQTVEYRRVNIAGPFRLADVLVRETWDGPTVDDQGRMVYDVTVEDVTVGLPRVLERVRHVYAPDGTYAFLATIAEDGTVVPWDPPQVVLPPDARSGASWSASHRKGASLSERSCDLQPAADCPKGGLTVVCDSQRDGGRIVLRDHYCAGQGWSGFEALVQIPGQPSIRMWSEDVVRDGRALPPLTRPEDVPERTPIDPGFLPPGAREPAPTDSPADAPAEEAPGEAPADDAPPAPDAP